MTLQKIGGLAALGCAATYIFGMVVLFTLLAGSGFGTGGISAAETVQFTVENAGLLITWNTVIYIVNSLALAVLVVALSDRIADSSFTWANITMAFGLIWATLVLGAGMLANITVERMVVLVPENFDLAVVTWEVLHAVELGLGGGNEIAGGVWILCISIAAWMHQSFGKIVVGLGVLLGLSGLLTIFPSLGDITGAVFGLGAILWFIVVGIAMLRK